MMLRHSVTAGKTCANVRMQIRFGLQKKEYAMSYSTISLWDVTEWTDAHEALARDKFVPMVMSVGADRVRWFARATKAFAS